MKKVFLALMAVFVLVLLWNPAEKKPAVAAAPAVDPPAITPAERDRKKAAIEAQVAADRAAAAEAPKSNLELLSRSGSYDEYSTTITGRIRNNTAHSYGYVQVTFNLYNTAGEQVGTALANVNNLEPGTVWKFKAFGFARGTTFKLGEITGF